MITFFSPSGYENSRKYPHADLISYIPFDTKSNAERFIKIVNPTVAVIMRYDIWPNIIKALNDHSVPVFLVDATMRGSSPRKYPFIKIIPQNAFFHSLQKFLLFLKKMLTDF